MYTFCPVARQTPYLSGCSSNPDNETELSILEHTTDTAGFTDLVFALFDLLGMRFSPRIRDMGSLQLYRTAAIDLAQLARIRDQVGGWVDRRQVIDNWEEMLRVAGSMKLGWVTASLFVQKLQSYPRQNELTRHLQEYGRLVRTLHTLRWSLSVKIVATKSRNSIPTRI